MSTAEQITMVITTRYRPELLQRTLYSFFKQNTYPITRIIVHHDGAMQPLLPYALIRQNWPQIEWLISSPNIGLSASLDKLLALVETEYVFTCEDDWLFEGNANFMANSLALLQHNPNLHQVWIRDSNDHQHPLAPRQIISGVSVRHVIPGYQTHWNGFSFNPGLRRMADLKRMFPNGLREYGDEIECAKRSAQFNYRAVSLAKPACRHIGYGHHTQNFKV